MNAAGVLSSFLVSLYTHQFFLFLCFFLYKQKERIFSTMRQCVLRTKALSLDALRRVNACLRQLIEFEKVRVCSCFVAL